MFSMWIVSAQRVLDLLLYRIRGGKPSCQLLKAICWNHWKPFSIGQTCAFTWRGGEKGKGGKGERKRSGEEGEEGEKGRGRVRS